MSDEDTIRNLYARYCFSTDRGTAEDIAALFWDDCTVNFGGNVNEGIDAARTGFAKWITKMREPVEGLRHCLYTPLIEIDGDRASVEAYYDADGHSKNKGKLIQLRGLYRSTMEKRGDEWRYLKHEVQIWRSSQDHGGFAFRPREKSA